MFVRGLEFACFSANIQTHGKVLRPYDFDEPVRRLYRLYAHLHDDMRPYLAEQGRIASKTGLPLMRALALWDSGDERCLDCEDEYMLGDAFLVAPVTDRTEQRDVYLPRGRWTALGTGEAFEGGVTLKDYPAPLAKIPVFVSADSASGTLSPVLLRMRERLRGISG